MADELGDARNDGYANKTREGWIGSELHRGVAAGVARGRRWPGTARRLADRGSVLGSVKQRKQGRKTSMDLASPALDRSGNGVVEEEGAGVGARTPEESSGSPRPWRSEARQQGAWVLLPARRRRGRGRGGRGNPRGRYRAYKGARALLASMSVSSRRNDASALCLERGGGGETEQVAVWALGWAGWSGEAHVRCWEAPSLFFLF